MLIKKFHYAALIIYLFSFFIVQDVYAQQKNFRFDHFRMEEGLSQTDIMAIAQDSVGFLWLGTQDGLNRFDGIEFKVFKEQENDSTSLPENWINSFSIDKNGFLWMGTISGKICKYNYKTNKFSTFDIFEKSENKTQREINCLYVDKNDYVWVGALNRGIRRAKIENINAKTKLSHITTYFNGITINSIMDDHNGILWFGTENSGVIKYYQEDDSFENFSQNEKLKKVNSILKDSFGNIWFGTGENGVFKYNPKINVYKQYKSDVDNFTTISDNNVKVMLEDSYQVIWFGTDNGLNQYDPDEDIFVRIFEDAQNQNSLSGNQIRSLYEDKSGIIWIGTEICLNRYDRRKNIFGHFAKNPRKKNTLVSNYIWTIKEDRDGELWIGTPHGISRYNERTDRFINYTADDHSKNKLSNNIIRVIEEDKDGNLWFGTRNGGLNKYNKRTNKFTNFVHNPKDTTSIASNTIRAFLQDEFGTIWVGTWFGLDKYNPKTNSFIHFRNEDINPNSISDNRVRFLYIDSKHNFWVGTYGGLNLFDVESKKFKRFTYNEEDTTTISNNRILCMIEDKMHRLWIGTFKGLNLFDEKTLSFKRFYKKGGLPNNVIYAILEDYKGNMWASTNRGITRFNPLEENITFHNYNVEDGLQGSEFNGGAFERRKNGELMFGGVNGITVFNPKFIKDNKFTPPVVLTQFKVYDQELQLKNELNFTPNIVLSYEDDFFEIKFASLDYSNPHKNRYKYILEGYNKDWINNSNRNYATFANIHGGEYTLKIMGSNSSHIWNPQPKEIKITIIPPFYETTLFRVVALLSILLLIYLIYKIKMRSMAKQKKDLEDQVKARTHELSVHNKALSKAHKEAEQFALQASLLTEVGQHVSSVLDLHLLLDEVVTSAQEAFGYYGVMLLIFDEKEKTLRLQSVAGGYKEEYEKNFSIELGKGLIGQSALTKKIQLSNDVSKSTLFLRTDQNKVTQSEIALPIIIKNKVIAILDIQSKDKNSFRSTDISVLETFGTQIASAINNAKLYEQSQNEIKERKRIEKDLIKSSKDLAQAKQETDTILLNVEEGLFLLDKNGEIGSQYSKSLEKILFSKNIANIKLSDIIRPRVPDSIHIAVNEYLELMFQENVDEEIINELNPLSKIELNISNSESENQLELKYLTFKVKRIYNDKNIIINLICTVRDITKQIKMEDKIQRIEEKQKKQIEWLLSILHVEAPLLKEFLGSVKKEVEFIDALLIKEYRNNEYPKILEEIYRSVHTIKGNASLLDVKFFSQIAHDFEDEIGVVQKKKIITGRDFVGLVLKLKEIKDAQSEIEELIARISNLQTHFRPKRKAESEMFIKTIENMVFKLSEDENKEVNFEYDDFNADHIPFRYKLIGKEVLIQLIRNSITHGIENSEIRVENNKSTFGTITLKSFRENGVFGIVYRDDGVGIQIEKLKKKAIELKKASKEEIEKWDRQKIVDLIFESGVSTAESISITAGRGIGMDIIKHKAEDAGGNVHVEFKEGEYCQFTIIIPLK